MFADTFYFMFVLFCLDLKFCFDHNGFNSLRRHYEGTRMFSFSFFLFVVFVFTKTLDCLASHTDSWNTLPTNHWMKESPKFYHGPNLHSRTLLLMAQLSGTMDVWKHLCVAPAQYNNTSKQKGNPIDIMDPLSLYFHSKFHDYIARRGMNTKKKKKKKKCMHT